MCGRVCRDIIQIRTLPMVLVIFMLFNLRLWKCSFVVLRLLLGLCSYFLQWFDRRQTTRLPFYNEASECVVGDNVPEYRWEAVQTASEVSERPPPANERHHQHTAASASK